LTVVRRIELATLTASTVMGKAPEAIVRTGALSTALLNTTVGVAALPGGDLLLAEDTEHVVLVLRQP
jgi:hypothetical protein